jgi:hypothetical protein
MESFCYPKLLTEQADLHHAENMERGCARSASRSTSESLRPVCDTAALPTQNPNTRFNSA